MIRINLLKNRGEVTRNATATDLNYEGVYEEVSSDSRSSESRDILLKVFILLGGVCGLIGYETYNIGEIKSEISVITIENNKLDQEIKTKKPIADKARELQKQIQDIESRIKAIKDLSKFRLREIKAVDYIQNSIPERVWLTSLSFAEDTLKIEGGAITDDELNRFLDALETKSYFRNVILLKAVEEKQKDGTVKMFQVNSNLTSTD